MDRTDYLILNTLQKDSRTTLKTIGEKVGLTPPAVSERIRKMEIDGVISSYRAQVDRLRLTDSLEGFILVATEPDKYALFCAFCENCDQIVAHHHMVGEYNAFLRFAVKNTAELDGILSKIKKFGDSRTSIELKTIFDCKDVPVPEEE